ncbi:MAG TPA: YihY/virulence factor BrkB family protein [Candidatus Kapabacteria bacterium]
MKPSKFWESTKYYSIGVYKYADEDHCFLLAAGIAFNVLYCIIPLSLVAFYFFSLLVTHHNAAEYIVNYIISSVPVAVSAADAHNWLRTEVVKAAHKGIIAGIVGFVTLFWLASALFSTLRTSLNAIHNMVSKKSVVLEKLLDFFLMVIVLVLLLLSTFLSPIANLLQHVGSNFLPAWLVAILDTAVPRIIAVVTSIILYVILFRMLPHERLSNKVIFVSAATTVVLTETMRFLFSYYMGHISSIGALYGTYAFLVGISLWIYYASIAFLVGAEVGWLYKERHESRTDAQALKRTAETTQNPFEDTTHHEGHPKTNPTKPARTIPT